MARQSSLPYNTAQRKRDWYMPFPKGINMKLFATAEFELRSPIPSLSVKLPGYMWLEIYTNSVREGNWYKIPILKKNIYSLPRKK